MEPVKEYAYIKRMSWYNDSNIYSLAPFWHNGDYLEVKRHYYDYWKQNDSLDILESLGFDVRPVDVLSGSFPSYIVRSELPEWYFKIYTAFLKRADAKNWFHLVDDAFIVSIPDELRDNIKDHRKEVTDLIDHEMKTRETPEDGWFVKSTRCSTKHDHSPQPVSCASSAMTHLLSSPEVCNSIIKGNDILVRPWIKDINPNCEVRVFVREGVVTGVSQQFCYDFVPMLSWINEKDIVNSAQRLYDFIDSNLDPKKSFRDECTFDSYISTDEEGEVDMHLIEINSGMFGWGPAGASLFSWGQNPPPQKDEAPVFIVAASL